MTPKKPSFTSYLKDFERYFEPRSVFDDFLTLTICAFEYDINLGESRNEDLYLETIEKYKKDKLVDHFPKLLGSLILEMEERVGSSTGNDVLGEYFEQNLSHGRNGQFFTPWPICTFMAKVTANEGTEAYREPPLRVLDPACGSGRMLMASAKENGNYHYYYGIDIDQTCTKMAVLNLFLNGNFHSEVMCANALHPDDFRISYRTSLFPLGIFRITEKEQSPLWNLHRQSFSKRNPDFENAPELPSNLIQKIHKEQGGSQLVLL